MLLYSWYLINSWPKQVLCSCQTSAIHESGFCAGTTLTDYSVGHSWSKFSRNKHLSQPLYILLGLHLNEIFQQPRFKVFYGTSRKPFLRHVKYTTQGLSLKSKVLFYGAYMRYIWFQTWYKARWNVTRLSWCDAQCGAPRYYLQTQTSTVKSPPHLTYSPPHLTYPPVF